jgi:hypothetical protein
MQTLAQNCGSTKAYVHAQHSAAKITSWYFALNNALPVLCPTVEILQCRTTREQSQNNANKLKNLCFPKHKLLTG